MVCNSLIYQGKYDVTVGNVPLETAGHGDAGVAHAYLGHAVWAVGDCQVHNAAALHRVKLLESR